MHTAAEPTLKFVPAPPEPPHAPGLIRFDRRRGGRVAVNDPGTAVFRGGGGRAVGRILPVILTDVSPAGAGLESLSVIEPGAAVTLIVNAPSPRVRSGRVVRCQPARERFRLGVSFAA
jgi:hypothetical protein